MASLLDGAGQIKMATLESAGLQIQRVHGIVERMAVAQRAQEELGSFRLQLQRAAVPLVGLLKPQFGMIADLVTTLLQVASRGGGDHAKVRAWRKFGRTSKFRRRRLKTSTRSCIARRLNKGVDCPDFDDMRNGQVF
jgi:hypothetical protein